MKAGEDARLAFERKFSTRELKEEDFKKVKLIEGETLFSLLCKSGLGITNSEIRRIFNQSGVKTVDKKTTFKLEDIATPGDVRVGKRIFVRIVT